MARKKKNKIGLFLNKRFDHSILIITLILLCLGLIMLLSASAPRSYAENGTSYSYFIRQCIFALIGVFLMFLISKFDYRNLKRFKWIKWVIYLVTIALLLLVAFMGVGEKGAQRWLPIFGFTFQPSEVAKVAFIIFFADILSDLKEKNKIGKVTKRFFISVNVFNTSNNYSFCITKPFKCNIDYYSNYCCSNVCGRNKT